MERAPKEVQESKHLDDDSEKGVFEKHEHDAGDERDGCRGESSGRKRSAPPVSLKHASLFPAQKGGPTHTLAACFVARKSRTSFAAR